MNELIIIIGFIAAMLIKHYLSDFIFQTETIVSKKGSNPRYLLLHSLHHALASFIVVILFFDLSLAALIFIAEMLIHTILDWIKANPNLLGRYQPPTTQFFIVFGFDQLLHQLTYLGYAYFLFTFIS